MSSRHRDSNHDHDDESRRRHQHRHHHHSSSSSRARDSEREKTTHRSRAPDEREERSSSRADESSSKHHHRHHHHHHHHRSSKDEGEEREDRGSRRDQREDSRSLSPDERRRRRRDDERDQDKTGGGVETAAFVHPSRAGLVPDARPLVVPDARTSESREEASRHRRRDDRSSSRHDEPRSSRSSATTSRARSPRRALAKFSESPPPMQYEVINERMKREHTDTYMTSSSAAADDDSRSRNPRSTSAHGSEGEPEERQLPNYATSGALLGDKLYKGVSLQYAEPDDSRKPDKSYRFYVFKAGEIVDTVRLDQQSVYLLGRDRTIVDLPLDHPSISKQQAVIQFRLVVEEVGFLGETEDRVAPFVYDLGSANGTMVNGEKVKEREYVELKVKDMLTFGLSSREYLLMCEDEVEEKK